MLGNAHADPTFRPLRIARVKIADGNRSGDVQSQANHTLIAPIQRQGLAEAFARGLHPDLHVVAGVPPVVPRKPGHFGCKLALDLCLVTLCLVQQLLNRYAFAQGQLLERCIQLLAIRRFAVPARLILHEADALALDRIGEDNHRLAHHRPGPLEGVNDLVHVVAVDAQNLPAEAGVLLVQRLHLHHVLDPAIDLQAIAIDDADDVVQVEVSGLHRGLPDLALLLFSIAHQTEDFVALAVQLGRQRHAHGNTQALSQRARGDLNPRQPEPVRVALIRRAELAQRHHVVYGTKARKRQSQIQARGLVPG